MHLSGSVWSAVSTRLRGLLLVCLVGIVLVLGVAPTPALAAAKKATKLSISSANGGTIITGKLATKSGSRIKGRTVTLYLDGAPIASAKTTKAGRVSFDVSASVSEGSVFRLRFKGDKKYRASASKSLTIGGGSGAYVGSSLSDKYHYPSCYWASQIHPENLVWFSSPADAQSKGYVPCKVCSPPF